MINQRTRSSFEFSEFKIRIHANPVLDPIHINEVPGYPVYYKCKKYLKLNPKSEYMYQPSSIFYIMYTVHLVHSSQQCGGSRTFCYRSGFVSLFSSYYGSRARSRSKTFLAKERKKCFPDLNFFLLHNNTKLFMYNFLSNNARGQARGEG